MSYHAVAPWLPKGSKLQPLDFMPGGRGGSVEPAMKGPSKAIARAELAALKEEMGVE